MRFFPEEAQITRIADQVADDISYRVGKAVRERLNEEAVSVDDAEMVEFVEACLRGDRQLASWLAPRLFRGDALARIDAALVRRMAA